MYPYLSRIDLSDACVFKHHAFSSMLVVIAGVITPVYVLNYLYQISLDFRSRMNLLLFVEIVGIPF
jgi:hypothetical protein